MCGSKNIRLIAVSFCLVLTSGCIGYWSTTRSNSATYAGSQTFGESSRVFPLEIIALGSSNIDVETSKVLSNVSSKIESSPSNKKALLYGDCGIAAMYANDLSLARNMLDQAFLIMNSVTVSGKNEVKATTLSGSESEKLFKGEPHERAVVSLYRGLLYLTDGDIENAHACFKSGGLQDALASNEKMRSNWLSLDLLLLESKRLNGFVDSEEWASYIKQRYEQESLPINWENRRRQPTIILIVVGNSPEKIAGKSKGEELRYLQSNSRVKKIRIWPNPNKQYTYITPVDNCYIQALTRGRRKMDEMLAKKATTKKGVEIAGAVAAAAAPLTSIGMIPLAIMKEVSWSISDSIDSSADIRQMRMVPGQIYLVLVDKSEIEGQLKIEILGEGDRKLAEGNISCNFPSSQRAKVLLARFPY